eukprot:scaffold9155_cov21-Phaeocystis_antarctica.AAC.1
MCRHGKGEQRQHVVASHAGRSAVRGGALCTSSKPAAIPCRARLVLGKILPPPPLPLRGTDESIAARGCSCPRAALRLMRPRPLSGLHSLLRASRRSAAWRVGWR